MDSHGKFFEKGAQCVLVSTGSTIPIPLRGKSMMTQSNLESNLKLYLAAGCFWGVQHKLKSLPGVTSTRVGYMGGALEKPTYKEVCTDTTGHAEVVEVKYDPQIISTNDILNFFWKLHDPTQKNRQGPDIGTQYRSAIFYTQILQQETATALAQDLQNSFDQPLTTEILPANHFWPAEDYHQDYFEKNGGSCGI